MFCRLLGAVTLAVCLLAGGGASAQSYRPEYRLSTVLGPAFPWGQAGERWAELVREKTQGRINIKLVPGSALVGGDQTREFPAIRQGVIDLAIGSTINWSPQVKELNLFSLPFLIPDMQGMDALINGPVGKRLFRALEANGVVPLAWGENGQREISNARRSIRKPADMKGLKVRVVWSPLFVETFTALGAKPIQMSWADLQLALSTGAVDGQENPVSVFHSAKMQNLGQKHLTLWHYVADPLVFVVNKEVWASWSPADQEAVRVAAQQAGRENIAKARAGISASDPALIKQLANSGVSVVTLSAEERAAFVAATRDVYARWAKVIGPELVNQAEISIGKR